MTLCGQKCLIGKMSMNNYYFQTPWWPKDSANTAGIIITCSN